MLNIVRSDSNPHLMSCRSCLPSAVISTNSEIVLQINRAPLKRLRCFKVFSAARKDFQLKISVKAVTAF